MDKQNNSEITTEQRILIAAREEFAQKRFYGAKTISIAQAAGVTHAMLHYYFRTKKLLYDRIAEENLRLLLKTFTIPDAVANGSIFDVTRSIIETQMNFFAQNPYIPRFVMNELTTANPQIRSFKTEAEKHISYLISFLEDRISEGVKQNQCRNIEAASLIIDILALDMMPFIISPLLTEAFFQYDMSFKEFVVLRTQENIATIMGRIKKCEDT